MGVSQHWGFLFGGPHNKDYSILGSISGSPYFGKLPNKTLEGLGLGSGAYGLGFVGCRGQGPHALTPRVHVLNSWVIVLLALEAVVKALNIEHVFS